MPTFSIVTINWNNLAGLQQTYQSLLEQSHRQFRWVVVDGASSDGSAEWLASLDEPRAEITSEPDHGIYDAMNKGLEKAVGQDGYTLFLNSGDTLSDPQVLQRVAAAIAAADTPPLYVYGDYYLKQADGGLRPAKAKSLDKLAVGMPSSHQAMYFENRRLQGLRYREDYRLSADYCLIIEFVRDLPSDAVLRLPTPLCVFDTSGISQRRRFAALREDLRIRREVLRLPAFAALGLYLLHYLHTHTKLARTALGR